VIFALARDSQFSLVTIIQLFNHLIKQSNKICRRIIQTHPLYLYNKIFVQSDFDLTFVMEAIRNQSIPNSCRQGLHNFVTLFETEKSYYPNYNFSCFYSQLAQFLLYRSFVVFMHFQTSIVQLHIVVLLINL